MMAVRQSLEARARTGRRRRTKSGRSSARRARRRAYHATSRAGNGCMTRCSGAIVYKPEERAPAAFVRRRLILPSASVRDTRADPRPRSARSAYFFYYIKEKGRSAALGRGGNRSSTQSRHSLRNCLLVDGGIDVLRGPRDYTSVSQALATAGYNGEQIVVVGPTQPIRALSLAGT